MAKKRRIRLPRQLKFTKEGKYFFWMTLGVGFAAINTGNNLLYLLLGMMLSLIIISGILSEIALQKLEVKRRIPKRLFAKTSCLITLLVTNNKRFSPSFSIEIEDKIEEVEKGKTCYFLKLSPGKEQKTAYRLKLPRRGLYHFQEVKISTSFPFSIFIKSKIVKLEDECIAYPQLQPLQALSGNNQQNHLGQISAPQRGQGIDFLNLRDYQPGDELRRIHWPSSARNQNLQVREFENEYTPQLALLLWNAPTNTPDYTSEQLDPAVDWAASYLANLRQQGCPVYFATAQQSFSPTTHQTLFDKILTHLALLEPSSAQKPPELPCKTVHVILPADISPPKHTNTSKLIHVPQNTEKTEEHRQKT